MSNLRELPPVTNDVRETLAEVMEFADDLDAVIIIGLKKPGCDKGGGWQTLNASSCDYYKKMFLVQFLNAWANAWFGIKPEEA